MPGKSRHARRKLSRKEKQRKKLASLAQASQQPAVAQPYEPVAPAKAVSTPSVSMPASRPVQIDVHYPYIAGELRRIGILAGAMLVVLIILSLVLP